MVVDAGRRRRPAHRALGRFGGRTRFRAHLLGARTAGTTPAAPCAAARWPARCPYPVPAARGSAATWAVTGSPRTCWCSPTASTTGRCPGTARTSSPPTSGARWRCRGCAAGPVSPRRAGRAATCPQSAGSPGIPTCRSPASGRSPHRGRDRAMDGDDGGAGRRRRRHGGEPAVGRRRPPHLPGDPPAHSRTWHVDALSTVPVVPATS